ncbi:hypothetical protein [Phytohabitans houttuyneae]|uniref:Glycosyltransferase RgtA/B/C/D-like domain-containing protein n=1 Tax=Phytohabitans houttuyneae TaxID=1076126 RepID=A0A6V8KSJ1_9ACTN|nr:hypothetical protein [Phytohabitans houttuyneae]GFJ85618.1 hypothetical protein Phou_097980 [Phytohabitans houttuyneae]
MSEGRTVGATAALATALAATFLALPKMGSDLSAQVARADFFADHGLTFIDLRWYGGTNQFGYSLVSQPVMALLGVRVTGALALVGAAVAFAALLVRTGVPRPLLGSLVGAVCIAGNLVSGRVTYALGVAFGLAALVALVSGLRHRLLLAGGLALLASATSPVAGLFVGLAGVALMLGKRPGGRAGPSRQVGLLDGAVVALAGAVPLGVTALLFGEGGWMNISRTDATHAIVTSLAVALLVTYRPVRAGALLSAAGVLAAALVHTPVGLNATRLAAMFALPVLAACARVPRMPRGVRSPRIHARIRLPRRTRNRLAAAGLVVTLAAGYWWQPPVSWADLRDAGNPTSDPAYFAPLLAELRARRPAGRIEVPPTRDYWEAAYLDGFPLARGWLRQVDIERNPLFFESVPGASGTGVALTPDGYRAWLADNAVTYVAVPDAELSWVGRTEAALVPRVLQQVWAGGHWRLFAVPDPTPIVAPPATLVTSDAATLAFDTPVGGDVRVRIRHSRWLAIDGGATLTRDGEWALARVPGPGRYTITS